MMGARQVIARILIVCMTAMAVPIHSHAGMLATEQALSTDHRERVAEALARADVVTGLERFGVSAADVSARVAAMTDEEVAQLAGRIDSLPAGGIVGAILLVFLVLLLTDILGLTKVFPFTKSIRQ